MPEKENPRKSIVDIMVAGYLARCNYVCSYKCLTEESPELRSQVQCANGTIMFDDLLHGKRLDEILIMFNESGGFLTPQAFLDFGSKLRDLANDYAALTNPDAHYSGAQKSLYGKRVPPSSQSRALIKENGVKTFETTSSVQILKETGRVEDNNASSSFPSSARRKCAQPVSTKSRLVENVMQAFHQAVESRAISEPISQTDQNAISLGESFIDNLDGSFLSYFPEMVASEIDFPDLVEPSTSRKITTNDSTLLYGEPGNFEEGKNGQCSSLNLMDIPQHAESKGLADVYQPVCKPNYVSTDIASSARVENIDSGAEVIVNVSQDENPKSAERSERKKMNLREKKVQESSDEAVWKNMEDGESVESASVSSSSVVEFTSKESDGRKKPEPLQMSFESLFGSAAESRNSLIPLVESSSKNLECKEKSVIAAKNDKSFASPNNEEKCVEEESLDTSFQSDLLLTPSTSVCEGLSENETVKEKQKADEHLKKVEGWVKLTSGKRGIDERKEVETQEGKQFLEEKQQSTSAKGTDEVERKVDETSKRNSSGKHESPESQPIEVNRKNSGEGLKKYFQKGNDLEKFVDSMFSPLPYFEQESVSNSKKSNEFNSLIAKEGKSDEVVSSAKSSVEALDSNSRQSLEEGELLSTPHKNKFEHFSRDDSKQVEKNLKKSHKVIYEKNSVSIEVTNKEKKKRDRESKMRREREEVEKIRRRQMEDEDRRAAFRKLKREKELEREAREKEEREARRRGKVGKRSLGAYLNDSANDSKKNAERDVEKRRQQVPNKGNDGSIKVRLEPDSRSGSREKSNRNSIRAEKTLEESLFSSEKSGQKQRDSKSRELIDSRSSSKKLAVLPSKSSTTSALRKEDQKSKSDKESKNIKSDYLSNARRNKNEVVNKRQDLFIDDLFDSMTPPPGCSKKDEVMMIEQVKKNTDFLQRVIATVEEKSVAERPKREKVVSSGVDKGRSNLLVKGGHSARGLPKDERVHVGMILEMATRLRRKREHEATVAATASSTASSQSLNETKTNATKPSSGRFSSLGSDKELAHRKRILDMPYPKAPVDLIGDILKETTYKETQVLKSRRYEAKRICGDRSDRSPLISSAESTHSSSLAYTSPRSYSLPDINGQIENVSSTLVKRPRLEDNAIDSVLDCIYGSSKSD